MPNAEINGISLYYEVRGEGQPVLYVHGGMGGARSLVRSAWDASEWAVPGFRFVFYDRRGCGRSEAPEDGYDLPTFAADALALLYHLGIDRTVVLGTSAGGPIALQLALDAPERVAALVLANTSAALWTSDDIGRLVGELLEVMETEGPEAAFERRPEHARHSLEPLWRWPEAEAHGWLDESMAEERELAGQAAAAPWQEQMSRHAAELRTCAAFIGADLTQRLGEIECPALLVHGETDVTVPFDGSRELSRRLPRAELVAVPNAGHMILNDPQAKRAVERFLRESTEKAAVAEGAAS